MSIQPTRIEGLLIVRWPTHDDERGFFRQTYQLPELSQALGRDVALVQGNHSRSSPGTLRGFHAEPWDKLVYVARGTALAAVADIRPDSATFGEVVTVMLGDPPGQRVRLFIGQGLANAFCAAGDDPVDYIYDVGALWRADVDKQPVAWDDPDLAVQWPVDQPVVSDADASSPTLRARFPDHPRWSGAARSDQRLRTERNDS